ncbi:MAG: fructose-bisphosphatase class III [Lachnospiraceae bacterium]|nr:fructose-bisphosphatase class III [Lachnospiraceae bacterium]
MIYVMSDIHGEYEKYMNMLSKIHFSDSDTLYVLGDVADRGPNPMKVLNDMSMRANVFPLIGNHDIMAYNLLNRLSTEITSENYDNYLDKDMMISFLEWQRDGGQSTLDDFKKLSAEDREYILEYLEEFSLYQTITVNEKNFILVHAGLGNFEKDKAMDDYSLEELAFTKLDFKRNYFDDDSIYIVTGHTPTFSLCGKPDIYHHQNNICIDCGACFKGGRLACLCLDTFEEFYV